MIYIIVGLAVISIYLVIRLLYLNRAIHYTALQMEEKENQKDSNTKLKAITANKKMEALLVRINKLYEFSQQERIQYQRRETQIRREIENISHDLRTPLTSIIGYVELILDLKIKEADINEYLGIIYKRAKVLQGFIEDFYELSRIEGEDYPLLYESIPVKPLLKEVLVSYYQQFERKQIQVDIQLCESPFNIIADKIQLNRILNNLVQNALKYSQSFFIIKQYCTDGEGIILFQNDTKDLSEQDIEHIFDRFYTVDKSRQGQNTGLGLTIAKILMEKMKGRITASFKDNVFAVELAWKIT